MAGNQTITVLEADGVTQTDVEVLGMGRQAAAASKSVELCTEDKAVLDSLATKLDTVITAVQLIDNLVLAVDTATGATSPGLLAVATRDDALSTLTPVEGDNVGMRTTSTGALWVQDASLNNNGQAVMASSSPVVIASDQTPIPIGPSTSGGLSIHRSIDLDETEEEVKATAGQVYSMVVTNTNAAVRYLKLYNATAATVVVGTTAPVITIYLPPTSTGMLNFGTHGVAFGTAICAAATTGLADNDAGAPGANEVIANIFYK